MRMPMTALAAFLSAAPPASAMSISSGDFADGTMLPLAQNYTRCGGDNVSPALSWRAIPPNTKTLVLTMIDINVKPSLWSHWVVVDLPPGSTGLERGVRTLPEGARAVVSNFGDAFYDGPCPPDGTGVHRYRFTLWALPRSANIPPNANAIDLQAGLAQIAIDKATIRGWVRR